MLVYRVYQVYRPYRNILRFPRFLVFRLGTALAMMLTASACTQQMADQPSIRPLEASPVFPDGRSAREPVAGTVPSNFKTMDQRTTETLPANPQGGIPLPVTPELLSRGRERFDIYCAVCHGRTGEGDGMIVQRGYSRPPSFHDDRLRTAPDSHFFEVMTNGFGGMPAYANVVSPRDRWAITAYIRALQLSQNASEADVPPANAGELGK